MMGLVRAGASLAGVSAALVLGSVGAFAYPSGSIGYDISYLNCGTPYPTNVRPGPPPQVRVPLPAHVGRAEVPVPLPQSPSRSTAFRTPLPFVKSGLGFGIVGVNSGYPFMSTHPGNPCLLDAYNHTPMASLYVNTGYDPIYTDANHTTADCTAQSASVAGSASQQAAWAVGCSEAQGDYAYASSNGITTPVGWWLDVETANSWCGQSGTNCTDLTLNQYTIQGIVHELRQLGAVPVVIYSNSYLWAAVVGTNTVLGAASDWYASGTSTSQSAAAYCSSSYSFSGAPVSLVQYLNGSGDRDYAC